jgi:hypothetical protein
MGAAAAGFAIVPKNSTAGYAIGGTGLAYGVPAMAIALGTSVRAIDSVKDYGAKYEEVGRDSVACGSSPSNGTEIALYFKGSLVPVPVGTTGQDGTLRIPWERVPKYRVTGSTPDLRARVVVGTVDAGAVDLELARQWWADRAWAAATAKNSADAYRDFMRLFPSFRPDDARGRLAEVRLPVLVSEIHAAVTRRDLNASTALRAEIETLLHTNDPRRVAPIERVNSLERELKIAGLWKEYEASLKLALKRDSDRREAATEAGRSLVRLEAIDGNDPRIRKEKKRIEALRNAIDRQIAAEKRAEERRELAAERAAAAKERAEDAREGKRWAVDTVCWGNVHGATLYLRAPSRGAAWRKFCALQCSFPEQTRAECLGRCLAGRQLYNADCGYRITPAE